MEMTDVESIRENLGLTGVVIVGFVKKNTGLGVFHAADGEVSCGVAAQEVMSLFLEQTIRNHNVDADKLSTLGAMICTEALEQALERMEKENVKAE